MRNYLGLLTIVPAILPVPALAQEDGEPDRIVIADAIRESYITVVASGDAQLITQSGQPVSIVDAREIARVQGADIAGVLERLPSVTFTRNGAPGGFTAMRVRGAEAEQLLVLVDGVRVADSAAPGGGFDFATLLPAGIEKIELLRGSNGTIWGSQAIGGVLAVGTGGRRYTTASAEYGGPEAVYLQAATGRPYGKVGYGIDAAFLDSAGFSSAADGTEPDGLRQWQLGGNLRLALADIVNLRFSARHVDARAELDGFPAPDYALADTAEYQDTRRTSASAGFDLFGKGFDLRFNWSLSDTRRESFDPALGDAPGYTTQGREQRIDLRGQAALTGDLALNFGGERGWSRMETLFDPEQRTGSTGGYAQLQFRRESLVLNAGLRREEHDDFGGAWNFGADGALDFGDGWRLRASFGEGFKAPTLFQLLSDYGNPALQPERSSGFDVGIEQGDRNDWLHLAATAFRRDSTGLIDFVSCFGVSDGICTGRPYGTYDNIGRTRAQGVELEASVAVGEQVRLQGAYSWVEAVNRTPGAAKEGNDLARRPRHALTLSADWGEFDEGVRLGADLRVVSGSFDDAANLVPLDPYAVMTVRASVPLGETFELFGRVENVWDEQYQTAAGYGTQGRAAYLGARARW